MLKQKKSLRTFGKTAKIDFKERTPKFLYRTKRPRPESAGASPQQWVTLSFAKTKV